MQINNQQNYILNFTSKFIRNKIVENAFDVAIERKSPGFLNAVNNVLNDGKCDEILIRSLDTSLGYKGITAYKNDCVLGSKQSVYCVDPKATNIAGKNVGQIDYCAAKDAFNLISTLFKKGPMKEANRVGNLTPEQIATELKSLKSQMII